MKHSLKSLAPSLLLIIIYFVADEFFGPVIGTLTAFILGAAEFIYTRIREKIYDKMILWTTLFFCIPGLLALFPAESVAARLQPALIGTGLCILFGIFAFSRIDLTATLPAGYRKNLHLSDQQQQLMRHSMRNLFFLLCIYTLFSYIAILFLSPETAQFVCGPLLYILLGGYFLFLFIFNRFCRSGMKKEEWLPIVNEKGEVTGQASRSVCHSGSMLLHPVVHLHILNEKREIFLQKRSMKKDLLPGMWDTAVGGHIGLREKVEDALKRETFEELGITQFEARFLGSYVWESSREKELVFSFLCSRYNQIHIDNEEVEEGRFWSKQEIEQGIQKGLVTPNFAHEYKLLLNPVKSWSQDSF